MYLYFTAKIMIRNPGKNIYNKQKLDLPATSVGIFVATEIWTRLKLALMQQRQQLRHLLWNTKHEIMKLLSWIYCG